MTRQISDIKEFWDYIEKEPVQCSFCGYEAVCLPIQTRRTQGPKTYFAPIWDGYICVSCADRIRKGLEAKELELAMQPDPPATEDDEDVLEDEGG